MVDNYHDDDDQTVLCCLCGDVGFPEKLFRCNKCRHRFQHSEFAEPIKQCDWCHQSVERNLSSSSTRHGFGSSSSSNSNSIKKVPSTLIHHNKNITNRSEYSGDKIKQDHHREDSGGATTEKGGGKNQSGVPSPRPTTRRYKLLKDVMC
ncbi:hypothetical protein ACFE04_016983 [Oxalis oulophora]